jgi:uncharacterized protein YraI
MTPTPTATPATIKADVDADVYSGPGIEYAIVGSLNQGDTAAVVGRNDDSSWWQIAFQGSTAWISDAVVTANAEAYDVPAVSVSVPGTADSSPATLPHAGGESWILVAALLLISGAMLLLTGWGAQRRSR